jgi:hypothetical protein
MADCLATASVLLFLDINNHLFFYRWVGILLASLPVHIVLKFTHLIFIYLFRYYNILSQFVI